MRPVMQEWDWDCHAACIASVLEMPLSALPEIDPGAYGQTWAAWERWHAAWDEWLASVGIAAYDITFNDKTPKGYTIATVESQRFNDSLHSVVCLDGVPVHDPQGLNERPYTADELQSHYLLVPVDPSVLVNDAAAKGAR